MVAQQAAKLITDKKVVVIPTKSVPQGITAMIAFNPDGTPEANAEQMEASLEGIPAMMRMFGKYGIDIRKQPILVYPTLHYQNGGLDIDKTGMTTNIENLYVAGEAVGGIHGRNRLMGNSLLDIIVFGRTAGKNASAKSKDVTVGKLSLSHVTAYENLRKEAGIAGETVSPKLLPTYTHGNPVFEGKKKAF